MIHFHLLYQTSSWKSVQMRACKFFFQAQYITFRESPNKLTMDVIILTYSYFRQTHNWEDIPVVCSHSIGWEVEQVALSHFPSAGR